MPTFYYHPRLNFADGYSQPSDVIYGRKLSATFDSNNIVLDSYGDFAAPVIATVIGAGVSGNTSESFSFTSPGQTVNGTKKFIRFDSATVSGNRIDVSDAYGALEVKELLPISQTDIDGYTAEITAYGNGFFIMTDAYGNPIDTGAGLYQFNYLSPMTVDLGTINEKIIIGNSSTLDMSFDGVVDEIKISSEVATKTRTVVSSGTYDVSTDYYSPVENLPRASTLTLLHCSDNKDDVVDGLREPLRSLYLTDSVLYQIVSKRNNYQEFIRYVDSLGISGSLFEGVAVSDKFSEQLYQLIKAINVLPDGANYYKVSGSFFPSDVLVNESFETSAIFSGETYQVERSGLISNKGTIELWVNPLFNLYGDLKQRTYLDIYNHQVVGDDGTLYSTTTNIIILPKGLSAKKILHVWLYENNRTKRQQEYDFASGYLLSEDRNVIILTDSLPKDSVQIIVDLVPDTVVEDRITLYKDEGSNLKFSFVTNSEEYSVSQDISSWLRDSWHRICIIWDFSQQGNNLNYIKMFVDGALSTTGAQYFKNVYLNTVFDNAYIGTTFDSALSAMVRMSNLRISSICRTATADIRGIERDLEYGGGSATAYPVVEDIYTTLLENFDPQAKYITKYVTVYNGTTSSYDVDITVRDEFKLVRGVDNGLVERMLRELIRLSRPAHTRAKIIITTK